MKIRITLKDPDGIYDSIADSARKSLDIDGLDNDDIEDLAERRHEKISHQCQKWIRHDEYVTIEIDTEAGTATVIKAE